MYEFIPPLGRTGYGVARSYVTGAELTFVEREGFGGDAFSVYRYRSDTEDFEVCLKGEQGKRQALALLPGPKLWGDLTDEGWQDLSKRQDQLQRSLNIVHTQVTEVRRKMPLDLALAEDLLQLVWRINGNPGKRLFSANYTAGFLNSDPARRYGEKSPYLKIDQDGVFSINDSGNW